MSTEFEYKNSINEESKELEKETKLLFDCIEKCKTIQDVIKTLIDIDLFQRKHKEVLGLPGRPHSEQLEKVLTNEIYWKLSNIKRLLEIRKQIIEKGLQEFASFSVGGSIGAGYLGYLIGADENGKMPEIIFGASAGSLFPVLFLLWKRALKTNKEETKIGIEGLLSYFPKNLGDKTMWSNGEELIEEFKKSGQILIDIINRGNPNKEKLPNIEDITIGEISETFGIISSRKKQNGGFQEVIFSSGDNLFESIIASSNPEISILGIKFSVLTNAKNRFLGNTWHDGDHTNYNPTYYGEQLGVKQKTQIFTLPGLQKYGSKKFKQVMEDKSYLTLDLEERIHLLNETLVYAFSIPYKYGEFISPQTNYKPLDQNSGWDHTTMSERARMTYVKSIIYFAGCGQKEGFNKEIDNAIQKIREIKLPKEEEERAINEIRSTKKPDLELMMRCEE